MDIRDWIFNKDTDYKDMLLGRLVMDCQMYLDGYRFGLQRLYKSNVQEHIRLMKDIFLSIPQDQLTGEFTMDDIEELGNMMEKHAVEHID